MILKIYMLKPYQKLTCRVILLGDLQYSTEIHVLRCIAIIMIFNTFKGNMYLF